MFVVVVMVVLVVGGACWLGWRDPVAMRGFLRKVSDAARAQQSRSVEAGRAVTPKVISDQVLRTVVKEAIEMPDGTRVAKTNVHVFLSQELVTEFGDELLDELRNQIRTLIDRELQRRGWPTSSATVVQIHGRSTFERNEMSVELARGSVTIISDPLETQDRGARKASRPPQPGLDLGGGKVYPLPEFGDLTLGRDPKCAIVYETTDAKVSRRHFTLVMASGGPLLTDISANGTWVDGKQVSGSVRLHAGSVICLAGPDRNAIRYVADVGAQVSR